ncbi:DJC16-like protein [Mya arenaria]|uniref:DJC16-like protein n=1 Tax=Mya arenaria TaxID=6604 RepID=A0ABY7EZV7_MYAAR|nr:DJC16-like protein [Mya arenaria]
MLIRIKLNYLIALFAICCLYFDGTKANNRELYDVLGVRQTATQKDIKRAYKNLARQWHPDKTDDPDATSKFTKINEAYETLGDPDKRHEYDNFGYTSANARQPNRPQQGFHGSPFDSFFPGGNGGFRFNFNNFGGDAESTIERFSINLSPREDLSARFLAPAYFYRENVAFGHIYTQSLQGKDMLRKFGVNKHRETLLLFNEDTSSPVATISMQQLSRSTLDEVIEGNKYLTLPRLSSQKLFEELCPDGYKVKNRKLCVVLITKKGPAQDGTREQFRQYSQASKLNGNERVRFTYMFEDTQADFVNTLMMKGKQKEADEALKVAILWRVEKYQLKYEWLETGWQAEQRARCSKALDSRLNVLLTTDTVMPYNIVPPELFNEHGLNLLTRIGLKLLSWAEKIAGLLNMLDSTTWITLLLTVLFVGGMGYFMHKLASLEEIQLDYRMYQELVTEADTGLTVVILVDKDSKDTLVKEYSALTFAFLQLEYNLKWYKSLLQLSVDDFKLDGINIKNCIGTVLAINGFRKYYYIYSAKNGRKYIRKRNNVSEALGLDEADEKSDEEENFFYLDEILDGLALWMDKIFDGSIKRIRITQWPELADKL